ncbi:sugar phosphate isomerase/epimerase family protein [Zunongwangia pacifica]|uniref:Sugar phosphate isomerase/epimerase n=1 Tax=Zunongwangia pacifica TaxID=2911062 RepID=A0A9X2CLJ4_9FLAO|nr:sugar phosphate isomerase/epimerase family protein [Zunongwangia pacifica]MCL6218580.1 sugar phosphate isomerase/epimerase [Zunongwangia pacifica]
MGKLGICSWILGISDINKLMEKVKSLGLDGVQLSGDCRQYDAKEVRDAADLFNLEIFAIDPFNCEPPEPQQANIETAVAFYKDVIDFAVQVKAPWVSLQGLPKWTINCNTANDCWEMLVHCCKTLDAYAQLKKVKIAYECVNRYESSMIHTAEKGMELIKAVGHRNFGLVLDSFHMHIEEPDPIEALRKAKGLLFSYHISDSNRSGIGRGQVDFVKHHAVLEEIGFEGPIMIEVVIPELVPTHTPKTALERERLDEEIRRSIRVWQNLKEKKHI